MVSPGFVIASFKSEEAAEKYLKENYSDTYVRDMNEYSIIETELHEV
jgi:hypothetical protein